MDNLSTLADLAEVLGVIIVVGGLYFAVLQMRQFRQQRRELAAIELFRFFGNPKFTEAFLLVLHLPDGICAEDIRTRQIKLAEAAMLISSTMENIGVMTYQRIVPFSIVNNLVGNNTIILWRKLEKWIYALRQETGNPSAFEWFQWLADQMEQYPGQDAHPAYEAHKDWVPAHLRHRI